MDIPPGYTLPPLQPDTPIRASRSGSDGSFDLRAKFNDDDEDEDQWVANPLRLTKSNSTNRGRRIVSQQAYNSLIRSQKNKTSKQMGVLRFLRVLGSWNLR